MVAAVDHGLVQNILQFSEVDQVTGLRIGRAADRDLEDIIVTMPVRVRTGPILLNVPSTALARIIKPMSRIEVHLPCDGYHARLDTGRAGMAGSGFGGHRLRRMRNGREVGLEWSGTERYPPNKRAVCYERRCTADAATSLVFLIGGARRVP